MTLKSPVAAQDRSMILDRLTATERVALFLLEMSERDDDEKPVELPMCRCIIGD
jgi:CRP/FNR family transcriptional regulator, nitrogen fixation regulation protein